MNETPSIERLRDYLLDRLPETEASEVELDLLLDDRNLEMLYAVEEELIDDYVQEGLTTEESLSFRVYLERLPDGPRRARFARALSGSRLASGSTGVRSEARAPWGAPSSRSRPSRRYRFALPATAAALLLVSVVSGTMILHLWRRVGELQGELASRASTAGEGAGAPRELRRVSFLLSPEVLRGGSSRQQIELSGADVIELRLDLDEDSHQHYRATLRDADGLEIVSASRLRPQVGPERITVLFLVPVESLSPGDFYVELEGAGTAAARENVARFDFRAITR